MDELGVGDRVKVQATQIAGEGTPRLTDIQLGGEGTNADQVVRGCRSSHLRRHRLGPQFSRLGNG
jgi:hypothetical protein